MPYALSILDKSPIPSGATAAEALAHTVKLARRADDLGYKRFWVAEHHATSFLASSAPEIVSAYLLAATRRIRIGSGGVMLQHYSPFKVAESFRVLENLAPGRVDLGVGKAPGGLPYATQALQAFHDKAVKPDFETALEQLDGFLRGPLPAPHLLSKAQPKPDIASLPDRILLGASPESAALAARLDWDFCYAGHFNGDPSQIERKFAAYVPASGRRPQRKSWTQERARGAHVVLANVSKSFGALKVLDNVSLEIAAGSVTVIVGQSGSGKSTLLRTIDHLESVDQGFIAIDGEFVGYRRQGDRLFELKERDILAQRTQVGMVFQNFNLFPHLTAAQNVAEAPLAQGVAKEQATAQARDLLARVGLLDKADAYLRQLSGGQQQRVAIARGHATAENS